MAGDGDGDDYHDDGDGDGVDDDGDGEYPMNQLILAMMT